MKCWDTETLKVKLDLCLTKYWCDFHQTWYTWEELSKELQGRPDKNETKEKTNGETFTETAFQLP